MEPAEQKPMEAENPQESEKKVRISEENQKGTKVESKRGKPSKSAQKTHESNVKAQPDPVTGVVFPMEPKRKPVIRSPVSPNQFTKKPITVAGIQQAPQIIEKKPLTMRRAKTKNDKKREKEPLELPKFIGMAKRAFLNSIVAQKNKQNASARS